MPYYKTLLGLGLGLILGASIAHAAELSPQTNKEGQVTVKVTPLALSPTADRWRFQIELDTHVTPLDQDLLKAATLSGGGQTTSPTAWEGDPPGGHHRKGVLSFEPFAPAPASVTLTIRQIGPAPERAFTWTLAKP